MPATLDVDRIAKLREAAGMSQTEAAKRAGFSPQRWHDIESGRKTNVELKTLSALADTLGCTACDLILDGKKKPQKKGDA